MKLDKETFIKHNFWFLLLFAVPVSLLAILMLMTSVPAQIKKKRDKLEGLRKTAVNKKGTGFVTQAEIAKQKAIADAKQAQKTIVATTAYNNQSTLFKWPTTLPEKFSSNADGNIKWPANMHERFTNGWYAIDVKAFRAKKNEAPPPPEKAKPGEFHGTVVEIKPNWVLVNDLKKSNNEPIVIYRTQDSRKITIDDKSHFFQDMEAGDRVVVKYEKGKFFGDALTEEEKEVYASEYNNQLADIINIVNPVDSELEGTVILRNWLVKKDALLPKPVDNPEVPPQIRTGFLHYISGTPKNWENSKFDEEDVWSAQEDLWIQREIYRVIAEANKAVSQFQLMKYHAGMKAYIPTEFDPKAKSYVFENPYWRAFLTKVDGNKVKLQLFNKLPRLQRMIVTFKITTGDIEITKKELKPKPPKKDAKPVQQPPFNGQPAQPSKKKNVSPPKKQFVEHITIKNTNTQEISIRDKIAIPYQQTPNFEKVYTLENPGDHIVGFEQVISWKQAAVKRIDQIVIGATSHRDAGKELRPFKEAPKKKEEPKTDGQGQNPMPGGIPNQGSGGIPIQGSGGINPNGNPIGKGQNPDAVNVYTKIGLLKNRYLKVSAQSRRIPIGIALIVDQRHIELVATAFRNSKLRFLTKQSILHKYARDLDPRKVTSELPKTAFPNTNPNETPDPGYFPPNFDPNSGNPGSQFPPGSSGYPGSSGFPIPMNPMDPMNPMGGAGFPPFGGQPNQQPAKKTTYSFVDDQDPNVEFVIYGVVSLYHRPDFASRPPRATQTPPAKDPINP